MSFLSFRHARRKAKKIVSARPLRPPTPPSPGSFASTSVVEIGDPTRVSPETYYPVVNPHMDVEIPHEPLFPSDPFLAALPHQASTLNSTRLQDGRTRSRMGKSSSIPPRDGAGLAQSEDRHSAGYVAVDIATRTPGSRRATKVTPSPIKIPTTSLASKVQIQRSAGKSAEPLPSSVHGNTPVDDTASAVSSVSIPAVLLTANVWTAQGDQAHHHSFSRHTTRLDSATLPIEDYPFVDSPPQTYMELSSRDGELPLPPLPPLPAGVNGASTSRPISESDRGNVSLGESSPHCPPLRVATASGVCLDIGKSAQISPITELPTPDASDLGTPDLITDSSMSAKGGSQPDSSATPCSGSSAWSGPASTASPASGEELTMLLERLSSNPSQVSPIPNQASSPEREDNQDEARPLLTEQRRSGAVAVARPSYSYSHPRSRSDSRPSLNNLLLRPTTLHPIGERRVSRSSSESPKVSQVMIPDEADRQPRLSSSLPVAHSTFQQSVTPSPSPLRLSSPPPSPDFFDHIVLADDGSLDWRERRASDASTSLVPGSEIGQTFPETPYVFSPMFSPSPGVDYPQGYTSSNSESSMIRQTSANRRLRRQGSQRFIVGRFASSRTSKVRKKPSKNKLQRSSTGTRTPLTSSSLASATNGGLSSRPPPVAGAHALDTAHSQRPVRHWRSESQRKITTPQASLTLPPAPPSQPPSPLETATEPIFSPASSSLLSLMPPPPPPQLHMPPPSHSKAAAVSPPAPLKERSSTSPPLTLPPSAGFSSVDDRQTMVFPLSPPHSSPGKPLASPSAIPGHAPVNHTPATCNTDRPHRPLGPRAPYRIISSSSRKHSRLPSDVSTDSTARDSLLGSPNASPSPAPTFRSSPPKFKGLTLEAAKWTFSSEELQAVVSDAIKWTGRPSSIRLLSPQAAFDEVPKELERLDALLHELRVQYRLQVRKRDVLLKATFVHAENPEFISAALRSKLQELQQTTASLDRIAEELYNARDQVAQLQRMLAVHSSSALAMALRKLHTSFVKQTAEVRTLRDYVSALEVERDEAWAQAQQVARDLDDLNETLHAQEASSCDTRSTSRRSSRVVASRKSSIRLSRGLRLSVAPLGLTPPTSQMGSARHSYLSAASPGSLTPSSEIPSMPPLSRRLLPSLSHIITSGLPSRSSVRTSDLSPSSQGRALVQAQADLYGYLGIDDPELMPPPPGRSSFVPASPQPTSPLARNRLSGRPLSDLCDRRMTWGEFSSDRLQASLENEPDAMLATFNLLDD
ncbi:hypothetical protein BC827DRAFT_1263841 [Russula dissimulans]|nr:hypothetical protein BC827DRAFT_1263841 [Russula dissimulans]